eukprot:snap_masked-scaffold_3-processed-gene-3.23-mRNA-1 protein AED:1.00 eAED:1.00 QI:0/0/0/0/1/1/3/0/163
MKTKCQRLLSKIELDKELKKRIKKIQDENKFEITCRNDIIEKDCQRARGFFEADGESTGIVLCENFIQSDNEVIELVNHEVTHAEDYLFSSIDLSTESGLACSEVRAAYYGECRKLAKYRNRFPFFSSAMNRCMLSQAKRSVNLVYPNSGVVDEVFSKCSPSS